MNERRHVDIVAYLERRTPAIRKAAQRLLELADQSQSHINALKEFVEIARGLESLDLIKLLPSGKDSPSAQIVRRPTRRGKKTKSRVYEEIFAEKGPLHTTALVEEAESRGVDFPGIKPKTVQAKDILYGSKRFYNFGNNVWGLPGQKPPSNSNGHDSGVHEQPKLITVVP